MEATKEVNIDGVLEKVEMANAKNAEKVPNITETSPNTEKPRIAKKRSNSSLVTSMLMIHPINLRTRIHKQLDWRKHKHNTRCQSTVSLKQF